MKPSKRIEELIAPLKRSDAGNDSHVIAAIIQYLDEQAELLDTHTVKEERISHLSPAITCEKCYKRFCPKCESLAPHVCESTPPSNSEKEERCMSCSLGSPCADDSCSQCPCHKEEVKEEPTTPEKKCCSIDGKNGYHSLLCSRPDLKKATPEKSQIDHSIFLFCRDPNCQVHQGESEKRNDVY